MAIDRDALIAALRAGVVEINYTKVSGEDAVMQATLMEGKVPPTKGSERAKNPDVVTVVDVVKNGWRSFRFENVKDFRPQ